MHGEKDSVIPAQKTWLAAERLRAWFQGRGSTLSWPRSRLSPKGVQAASKFLARQLDHDEEYSSNVVVVIVARSFVRFSLTLQPKFPTDLRSTRPIITINGDHTASFVEDNLR